MPDDTPNGRPLIDGYNLGSARTNGHANGIAKDSAPRNSPSNSENSSLDELPREPLDRLRPYPGLVTCFLDTQVQLQEYRYVRARVDV